MAKRHRASSLVDRIRRRHRAAAPHGRAGRRYRPGHQPCGCGYARGPFGRIPASVPWVADR